MAVLLNLTALPWTVLLKVAIKLAVPLSLAVMVAVVLHRHGS